jgi:hypothetical protein
MTISNIIYSMLSIQQDILWDDSNEQAVTHIESVMMIRIGVHPVEEEPDQHIIHAAPWVSHMTTVHEVPTKSKSGFCSQDEVLAPSDRPSWPSS